MTDNLINFRHDRKKSIVEFAKILGISYDSYSKIERNQRNPNYKFLCKFKIAFPDANIDEIFFKDNLDIMSKNI